MRFFLFALTLLSVNLSAQKFKSGPVYEADFSGYTPVIKGEDENNLYLATDDYGDLIIEAFDKRTLRRVYTKTLEDIVPRGGFKTITALEKVIFIDGYYVVFISGKYFDDSYSELYVHRIEASTGEKVSMDTLLHKKIEDLPVISTPEKLANRLGRYHIHSSRNNKRFVLHYTTRNYEIGRYFDQVLVVDGKMNVLLDKEFIREKASQLIPSSVDIDNEGSLYYLDENDIVFLDFYQDYEEWREPIPTNILESNAYATKITATFNNVGNLIITAAYVTEDMEDTDEEKESKETREGDTQVEGMVYLEVDGFNKEIVKVRVSKFDEAFFDEFRDKYHVKREQKAEFNNILTRFRYHFTENSTILVGHAVPSYESTGRYEYNSVVVFSFNKEGELNWAHRIPKFQVSSESNTLSGYLSFLDKRFLYVFFQDDEDNFEGNKREVLDLRTLTSDKHAMAVLYTIDLETGKKDYEAMRLWNAQDDLKPDPYLGRQENPGDPVFLFSKDRKDYRLSRVDLRF